jgi:hypothetical protein
MIAGLVYLLIVMAGYGIYNSTIQPDSIPQHNDGVSHE